MHSNTYAAPPRKAAEEFAVPVLPCDRHRVVLRDRVGAELPLKADAGCRNTVFNARAQTGADHAVRLREAGGRHFRIEFVDEPPAQVAATLFALARRAEAWMLLS